MLKEASEETVSEPAEQGQAGEPGEKPREPPLFGRDQRVLPSSVPTHAMGAGAVVAQFLTLLALAVFSCSSSESRAARTRVRNPPSRPTPQPEGSGTGTVVPRSCLGCRCSVVRGFGHMLGSSRIGATVQQGRRKAWPACNTPQEIRGWRHVRPDGCRPGSPRTTRVSASGRDLPAGCSCNPGPGVLSAAGQSCSVHRFGAPGLSALGPWIHEPLDESCGRVVYIWSERSGT